MSSKRYRDICSKDSGKTYTPTRYCSRAEVPRYAELIPSAATSESDPESASTPVELTPEQQRAVCRNVGRLTPLTIDRFERITRSDMDQGGSGRSQMQEHLIWTYPSCSSGEFIAVGMQTEIDPEIIYGDDTAGIGLQLMTQEGGHCLHLINDVVGYDLLDSGDSGSGFVPELVWQMTEPALNVVEATFRSYISPLVE